MGGSTSVTRGRAVEYDRIRASVIAWAGDQEDIHGVAVVGSWARGAARWGPTSMSWF